jgi:hypothetical protein
MLSLYDFDHILIFKNSKYPKMKSLLLIALYLVSFNKLSVGQKVTEDKVPAAVSGSFKDKFSTAFAPKWSKEGDEYEVDFKIKKDKYSAKFNNEGKWLETEQEIKIAELPMAIQNNIKKAYPAFKIEEVNKMETLKDGSVYEAEVIKGKESWDLIYTMDGKLLSKMKEVNDHEKE